MGVLRNIFTKLHQKTKRDYFTRMADSKVECMDIAKKYEKDFWDGVLIQNYILLLIILINLAMTKNNIGLIVV